MNYAGGGANFGGCIMRCRIRGGGGDYLQFEIIHYYYYLITNK